MTVRDDPNASKAEAQAVKKHTDATQENTKAQEESNAVTAEAIKLADAMQGAREGTQEQIEQNIIAVKALDTALLATKTSLRELTQEDQKFQESLLGAEAQMAAARKAFVAAKKGTGDLAQATVNLDAAYKNLASKRRLGKVREETESYGASVRKTTTSLVEAAIGIKTTGNAFTGLLKQLSSGASASDLWAKSFGGVHGITLAANMSFGVLAGVMSKFGEATIAAVKTSDDLRLALGRDTGIAATYEATEAIYEMSQESDVASTTFASLGRAIGSLQVQSQGMFGNLAEGTMDLANFTEEMRATGISTQTSGELFVKFGKILGTKALEPIKNLETDIIKLAKRFHMSSEAMVKDVASMADSLAQFGEKSAEIALAVAGISAATKISSQSILKFGESFEFMPEAIKKANELNLIFGRTVIDGEQMWQMMNDGTQGPAKAFNFALTGIAEAMDEAFVKSPINMRAFAAKMNLSGVEAAKMAESILKAKQEVGGMAAFIEKETAQHKEKADALGAVTSIQDELNKLQEKFVLILGPITSGLAEFVKWVNSFDAGAFVILGTVMAGIGMYLNRMIKRGKQMGVAIKEGAQSAIANLTILTTVVQRLEKALDGAGRKGDKLGKTAVAGGGGTADVGGSVEDIASTAGNWKNLSKGAKGASIAGGIGMAAGLASTLMEEGSTEKKVAEGLGVIGGMAATGATIGSIIPGLGTGVGALIGGALGAVQLAMADGIVTVSGGKASAFPLHRQDDITMIAQKPGGPLSSLAPPTATPARGGGADAVEIVVNLFGKELVRELVDLVEEEQGFRAALNVARSGR